jgi:3-hydroxy acid dehydrogenase / malonic semialdehyde reductase
MYEGTEPIVPEDIADAVYWAASRPAHLNINSIQMMPVCQSFGPLPVSRTKKA